MRLLFDIMLGARPSDDDKAKSAWDFHFTSIKTEEAFALSDYRGKVLLIVNTASKCGFTKQYSALQTLWDEYRAKGLVVIAVPSNDFGGQEPGSEKQIKKFCRQHYGVTFPMTMKENVRGPYAHPFYLWARTMLGGAKAPKWNFHKYLVSGEGKLVDYFLPFTSPNSQRLRKRVERCLAGKA